MNSHAIDFNLPENIIRQNPNVPGEWQRWHRANRLWMPIGDAEAVSEFAKNNKNVFFVLLLSDRLFRIRCDQATGNKDD